jgi:FKBP-type peptidyl-prolyl cis-trans isomerase FklB
MKNVLQGLVILSIVSSALFVGSASESVAQVKKKSTGSKPTPTQSGSPTPVKLSNLTDSMSYVLGMNLINNIKQQEISVNPAVLMQAINDGFNNNFVLKEKDMMEIFTRFERIRNDEKSGPNKQKGMKFLSENAKKPGVVTTASGLQYKVIKMGNGAKPAATDKVKVHYRGTLIDGKEFDSSYKRGEPIEFPLNGVIKGWTEGVQLMPVGSKFEFYIPSDLAYGDRQAGGDITPGSTLIFEVELLDIVK